MINSEQLLILITQMIQKEAKPSFVLGTIKSGKVQFDGEDATSNKTYKKLNDITLSENDRVLLAAVSGTFVILGKLT